MDTTPSQLVGFLVRLRLLSSVFQISDSQFLAAHQLIGGLAAAEEWPSRHSEWCALLGPVLCSTALQLEQFADEFERHFHSPEPHAFDDRDLPTKKPREQQYLRWVAAASVLIAVGVPGLVKLSKNPGTPIKKTTPAATAPNGPNGRVKLIIKDSAQAPIEHAMVRYLGKFPETGPDGAVTADFTNSPGGHYVLLTHPKFQTRVVEIPAGTSTDQNVTLLPGITSAAAQTRKGWVATHALALYAVAIAAPLLAFLGWFAMLFHKVFEIRKMTAPPQARMEQIGFEQAGGNLFRGADIRRLATGLRRRRPQESGDLAAQPTAEATARAAGYFTPVYARRHEEPEYLAILEQKNSRDHQTRLQDELFARLRDHDVAIQRFYFLNDPSVCFDSSDHILSTAELAARYPRHELWLYCGADKCVNPVSGKLERWTRSLSHWRDRVLLSAIAVEPEVAAAAEVRAATPTRGGLETLTSEAPRSVHASSVPDIFCRHPEDWLDPVDPGAFRFRALSLHLRGYLGDHGYLCLQACAVYPELAWNITASAAAALVPAEEIETVLESLTMLPWFRHGAMPEWFRIGLVKSLGPNEAEVRTWLQSYLAAGIPGEQKKETLNLVSGGSRKSGLIQPDHDRVYLWFVSGRRLEELSVGAPGSWFKLVIAPLLLRALRVLLLAAAAAGIGCLAVAILSRQSTPPGGGPEPDPPARPKNIFVATMLDAGYGLASSLPIGNGIESASLFGQIASDVLDVQDPLPRLPMTNWTTGKGSAGEMFLASGTTPQPGYVALGKTKGGLVRDVTPEGIFVFGELRPLSSADVDLGYIDFSGVVPPPHTETVPTPPPEVPPPSWNSATPDSAWCYQERKSSGSFGAYCHWSEANCLRARSAAATACALVTGLRKTSWRPAPKGYLNSWWQEPMSNLLPPPFPQFAGPVPAARPSTTPRGVTSSEGPIVSTTAPKGPGGSVKSPGQPTSGSTAPNVQQTGGVGPAAAPQQTPVQGRPPAEAQVNAPNSLPQLIGPESILSSGVPLSWKAGDSPTGMGYSVYRSATTGGPYTKLNSRPVSSTSYVDTTVQPGQAYFYVITALDKLGSESAYSNEIQVTVPGK